MTLLHRLSVLLALLAAHLPDARAQLPLLHTFENPTPGQNYRFGYSVAAVPDLDGNGRADILVGAPFASSPLALRMGRAYAFSSTSLLPLDTLISTAANVTTDGAFGTSVAGVPDINADGRGDYLIGAPGEDVGSLDMAGRVYVYSGIAEVLLHTLVSPNAIANGSFGNAVAAVPDVNGDGVVDLLVGASREDVSGVVGAGRAYLFSGATGALIRTLRAPALAASAAFGQAVAGVSDVDGDGRGDLLIGSYGETVAAQGSAGRAYLFSGVTGVLIHTLTTPNPTLGGRFGGAVASVPDTDGDGRADLLVGAYGEPPGNMTDPGRAYLFSGATGALRHVLQSPMPQFFGNFGWSVAGVPDVNGDGRGDLLVGARLENGGAGESGRAHLLSGRSGTLLRTLTSPNPGLTAAFGYSVAAVADADGDGRADLLVGAPDEDAGSNNAGRAYLFSTSTIVAAEPEPGEAALAFTAWPNPAAGPVALSFALASSGAVRLVIYDVLGREVAVLLDGVRPAGPHEAALDASALPPGLYLARLEAGGQAVTRQLVVAR